MSNEEQNNLKAVLRLEMAAKVIARLPTMMAEYYANGGKGVGQAVVGDRFQGKGNARFAPLSRAYFLHKQGIMNQLNQKQRETYGKGSKILKNVPYHSSTGSVEGHGSGANLPILVLSGKTRAAVIGRKHPIVQDGDTATITFQDMPVYSLFLHTGTKRMPQRSPVEPNSDDMARVIEYADRQVAALLGEGTNSTTFGQGIPRTI